MIRIQPAALRGSTRTDWLDSRHSFSFNQYYDENHMNFRTLRVINEDVVAPGAGFGTHPHRNMEILTWVLEGALEHRDSTGGHGVIRPGELQRMSAGTGVLHSEFNASPESPVHLLQIWILPERNSLAPGYEQLAFPAPDLRGKFALLAGPSGPVTIHQDAELHVARLEPGESASHRLAPGRGAWVQVARGAGQLNGQKIAAGDGAAVSAESAVEFRADAPSEVLVFDLA
jgi:quercetin 2,3-dioxygenase